MEPSIQVSETLGDRSIAAEALALIRKADSAVQHAWHTWVQPEIATPGRGNWHVDRMG